MNLTGDYHIHTNFCPHGTKDSMEAYVIAAIERGLKQLSFTEHAPLPQSFEDPTPEQDSAMRWDDVDKYFAEGSRLKEKYRGQIAINIGFEVDFIEGFEEETKQLLDYFGNKIDDSILSVHMLKAPNGEYVCIDYSSNEFERIAKMFGSVDAVYKCYYKTLEQAINTNLGAFKPTRIGHITLIEKFSKVHQAQNNFEHEILSILELVKHKNYELDANTAGFFKEYCESSYPNTEIMRLAEDMKIPLVPGSDSHTSDHIGRGYDFLPTGIRFAKPNKIIKGL